MPLRPMLEEQLTLESIDRLDAFFNLVEDRTLQPAEKLALAYSGTVVGSTAAVTDLRLAIRLWEADHAIMEYLRTDSPQDHRERLNQLAAIDGLTPELVLKLVQNLPPIVETPDIRPAVATSLQVSGRGVESNPTYGVLLPPEYDWHHKYPMIVSLHPAEHNGKAEIDFWGGTAAKPGRAMASGYIVITPEYVEPETREYGYSMASHDIVLRSIIDARKRFNVDSDRIFLTGHGMGGDAAFDIGMSHPDLFAGVIPINGICNHFCDWYWQNAGHTAWYVVTGEFDARNTFNVDAKNLTRMMKASTGYTNGMDVVLVEFVQRGYESYFEETRGFRLDGRRATPEGAARLCDARAPPERKPPLLAAGRGTAEIGHRIERPRRPVARRHQADALGREDFAGRHDPRDIDGQTHPCGSHRNSLVSKSRSP